MTTVPEGDDEQVVCVCPGCGVKILVWWNDGVVRGEYVLVADWVYHPRCWDRATEGLLEVMAK